MAHYSLSIIHCALLIIETAFLSISTGQTGPALSPAPINNSATCFRRHPFAKSMIPGPLDPAGLKSAFHAISSLYYYKFFFYVRGVNDYAIGPGDAKPQIFDINHKVDVMSS